MPRPVYGSESAHRPNALGYGPGNVGGYGTSGYGGNGRPTGYGGGGGYGITGTLADGDEFGPSEVHPEGSVPQLPGANIQTQKVYTSIIIITSTRMLTVYFPFSLFSSSFFLYIYIKLSIASSFKRVEEFVDQK